MDRAGIEVVIFYQGEEARNFDLAALDCVNSLPVATARYVKDRNGSSGGTILDRVFADIRECDAAIAVLTRDTRLGSEGAGNLWFEVGAWLAAKRRSGDQDDGESLLMLVQSPPEVYEGEWKVQPISDFGTSRPAGHFSSEAELKEHVTRFIYDQVSRRNSAVGQNQLHDTDGKYSDWCRVMDTMGDGVEKWPCEAMGFCEDSPGHRCSYREQSLPFIAELFRMARANREHAEVEEILFSIARSCTEAIRTDDFKGENRFRGEVRKIALEALISHLGSLRRLFKDRMNRTNACYGPAIQWSSHLEKFLLHRVEAVENAVRSGQMENVPRELAFITPQRVHGFCGWAAQFSENPQLMEGTSFYKYGQLNIESVDENGTKVSSVTGVQQDDETLAELRQNCDTALKLAMTFADLGRWHFWRTRDVIKRFLGEYDPGDRELSILLRQIRENLPHNASTVMSLWPSAGASGEA